MIGTNPAVDSRLLSAVVRYYGLRVESEGADIALRTLVGYPRPTDSLPDTRGTTPILERAYHGPPDGSSR
jgi:Arc/MetJ family transcription regulator